MAEANTVISVKHPMAAELWVEIWSERWLQMHGILFKEVVDWGKPQDQRTHQMQDALNPSTKANNKGRRER